MLADWFIWNTLTFCYLKKWKLYSNPFIYLFIFGTKLKRETAGSLAIMARIYWHIFLSLNVVWPNWDVGTIGGSCVWIIQFADWSVICTPPREASFIYIFIYCYIQEVMMRLIKRHQKGDAVPLSLAQSQRPSLAHYFFFCDLFCFFCSSSFPRVRFLITSPSSCCCYCALGRFPCVL